MTKAKAGRPIVAVLASYLAMAILVSATEQLLSLLLQNHRGALPLSYFVVDLISQIVYTIVAGYLCHLIAPGQPIALEGLIAGGLLVGAFSLVRSWNAGPRRERLARSGLSRVAALAQMILSAYHGHISITKVSQSA